jgi:peptidoglycan/LPS O-acetylase OafA/YrhL
MRQSRVCENEDRPLNAAVAPSGRRIPQLDGIRGAAILLVVVWHFVVAPAAQVPDSGMIARIVIHLGSLAWSGVDLFFVLSGFLIGGILIDSKDAPRYFATFYIRRVFRILPIYLLIIVGYLVIWTATTGQNPVLAETLGRPVPWYVYLTFTQNIWFAYHGWVGVFLALSWSLAVEEQFYLLLPAIIRVLPRSRLLPVAIALALGSAAVRTILYLHYGPAWALAAYMLIITRADALMLGVICALLLRDERWKTLLTGNIWIVRSSLAVFGLGMAIFIYKGWGMGTRPMCTLGFSCVAAFYASLLMIAMISPDGWVSRVCQTRWLMRLGAIAYGMYLIHQIALDVAFRVLRHSAAILENWHDALTILLALAVAVCLAQFSWRYFESKLVRFGHRFTYGTARPVRVPVPN